MSKKQNNESVSQLLGADEVFNALNDSQLTNRPFGVVLFGVNCPYKEFVMSRMSEKVKNLVFSTEFNPEIIEESARICIRDGNNFVVKMGTAGSADPDARGAVIEALKRAGAVDIVAICVSPSAPEAYEADERVRLALRNTNNFADDEVDQIFVFDENN